MSQNLKSYIKPGDSDIKVFERILELMKKTEDPAQKFAYIDLLTDWLFYMSRLMRYPPAYIAFYGNVQNLINIKELMKKPEADVIELIQKITDYYSKIYEALKEEEVDVAVKKVIEAIEEIAIPLRFEISTKYSFYLED